MFLDARFNKGLIENCQADINKHCKSEIVDSDDDNDDDDKGNNSQEGKSGSQDPDGSHGSHWSP